MTTNIWFLVCRNKCSTTSIDIEVRKSHKLHFKGSHLNAQAYVTLESRIV